MRSLIALALSIPSGTVLSALMTAGIVANGLETQPTPRVSVKDRCRCDS